MKNKILALIAIFLALVFVNNSSMLSFRPAGKPLLLAHRGLGQTYSTEGMTNDTNTAERIFEPEHPYIENTLPSMEAAFAYGADVAELDIHPTTDGQFAVFHDWTLEYRTDGQGVTREQSMSYLKTLDVGYGYTADHGQSYPFRGQGIGMMPTLDEVLTHFPDREFLIHIKSNDPQEGELLADYLERMPESRQRQMSVYGGDKPIAVLQERLPELRVLSYATLKSALLSYMAVGWTGYVPEACRNTELHIPIKYAWLLWGWPDLFLTRMDAVNTRVILVGGNGTFSEGIDSASDLKALPDNYTGGIWTDRIDRIGPIYYK